MNFIRFAIPASLAAACMASGALAHPNPPVPTVVGQPTTKVIRTADLDLTSEKGRHRLVHRIKAAAEFVCKEEGGPSATPAYANTTCYHAALADGRAQMQRIIDRGPGTAIASISLSAMAAAR